MQWPSEIGVMILQNVILFPQAYLPLFIFEPRYRRMLDDALHSHRFFCVSMQLPGSKRPAPSPVAGLGIIRASRQHTDGTSHLVLQGVARVALGKVVRYRPYRTHEVRLLSSRNDQSAAVDALSARLLELVADQLQRPQTPGKPADPAAVVPPAKALEFLAHIDNPEQLADLVSWALLTSPGQRQLLLETLDVESRLRRLIQFILAQRGATGPEPLA